VKRLGCGHVFHATCVDLWGETAHTCPLCKTDFAELAREAAAAGEAAASGAGRAAAPARRPSRWLAGFTMLRTAEDPRGRSSSSSSSRENGNGHTQHNGTVGSEDDDDDGHNNVSTGDETDSPDASASDPLPVHSITTGGAPSLSQGPPWVQIRNTYL